MSTFEQEGSKVGKIVTWLLIGILAIVAIKVGLAIAGFLIGLGFFALFTVGPILLVGWLVWKALRYFSRETGDVTM